MALVDIREVSQTVPPDLVEIDGAVDPTEPEASLAAHAAQLAVHAVEQTEPVNLPHEQTVALGATASRRRTAKLSVTPRQRVLRRRPGSENITDLYLDDIGQEDRLTRDDEVELSKRVQSGLAAQKELDEPGADIRRSRRLRLNKEIALGESAEATFVTANLRLVVPIAKRYADGDPALLLDFVQDGNLGLMRAAQKFDWRRGFTFANHATWWIKQSIQKGPTLRSRGSSGGIPPDISALVGQYRGAIEQLRIKDVTNPTDDEVAEFMSDSVTVNDIHNVRAANNLRAARLDEPVGEESATTMGDLLPDQETIHHYSDLDDQLQTSEVLRSLRDYLSRNEYLFLIASFGFVDGEPMSNGEISEFVSNNQEPQSDPATGRTLLRLRADTLTKLRHPAMYSILKQLMPELLVDQEWQAQALCVPEYLPEIVDTNLGKGANIAVGPKKAERDDMFANVERFKEVCRHCPVWSQCLEYAKSAIPKTGKGVWGGELFGTHGVLKTPDDV